MLFTSLSFFLWIPAILGVGSIGHLPYHAWVNKKSNETIIENGILGMALISAISNWLNLFFAISNAIQIIILLFGWICFLYALHKREFKKPSRSIILGAIIVGVGLSFLRSHVIPSYYDSGYYGLQNVLWYNTVPLPLGLANLHARFAYNSAWLALISIIQFPAADFFYSGELLIWFMSFILLSSIEASVVRERSPSVIYGLVISLIFLTPLLGTFNISSLATDYPVFWLFLVSGWVSLRLLEGKLSSSYAWWFTIIVAVWGITLKLSAFPLFFIAISQVIIERKDILSSWKKIFQGVSPFVFFIITPWIIRFFIISGCFIYPLAFTCIPEMRWSVPLSSVKWMSNYIQQFAINHTLIPADIPFFWFADTSLFKDWAYRYLSYPETWVLFFFIFLGIVIYLITLRENTRDRNRIKEMVLIFPYVIGIVFWFITAPSIRFANGYLWGITLLLLSMGIFHLIHNKSSQTRKLGYTFINLLLSMLFLASFIRRANYLLLKPFGINWIFPPSAPSIETYYQTIDDVDVRYPVSSDLLCWEAPLPCTPELNDMLRIKTDNKNNIRMFYLE